MNYTPQRERALFPVPATKAQPEDIPFEHILDNAQLVRTQLDIRPDVPRPPPQVQVPQVQVPTHPPGPVSQSYYPIVSDDYIGDLRLAHLLMQPEENLDPAAISSLSLDAVVYGRTAVNARYATAPRGRRAHRARSVSPPAHPASGSPTPSPPAARPVSPHASPAVGRFSLPPAPLDDVKPYDDHPLRPSHSYPVLASRYDKEPVKAEADPDPAPAPASPSPAPSNPPPATLAAPEPVEPAEHVDPPQPPPAPSSAPATGTRRPAGRAPKRSPAPRRQECKTCGKKFQRPCQLTTHIRSHTGEQPHACPVCSRRFSVLSNCQRHVKLCQKRVKPPAPGNEEPAPGTEPGPSSSSFMAFAEPTPEDGRRSNEIPIRPKLVSRPSGSGNSSLGLERSESVGSAAEPVAGPSTVAGTSTYSPAGTGVGFVPYDESGPRSFEPIYEEPSSEYAANEPAGYDANAPGAYEQSVVNSSSYDTNAGVPASYDANYDSTSISASNSGSFGHYPSGYGPASNTAYGQPSPATGNMDYGHYSHPSPSHIRPLPSPSHVHNSPATYNAPLMMNTPTMRAHPTMHDPAYAPSPSVVSPTVPGPGMVSPSVPSSGMLTPASNAPGMTMPHSTSSMGQVPLSHSVIRRSTMSGVTPGYSANPIVRRQTVVPSMSEPNVCATRAFVPSDSARSFVSADSATQSFAFPHSPADVINRPYEPEVKLENVEGPEGWSQAGPAQASAFQTQQTRAGYDWSGQNARFHPYGSAGPSNAYSYAQQHDSQMYGQSSGFVGQHESFKVEQNDYSGGVGYANTSYEMPQTSDSGDVKMSQQPYSDYSWSGPGSQWSGPGYSNPQ
ncbi:C2H2 zinc finger [Ceratobasidium sp. AG-Ba]|nr:C2H2 zinc finger [Ceratobasidium sp. AG-Ba]